MTSHFSPNQGAGIPMVEALAQGKRHEVIDRMVELHNDYRAVHGIGALAVHETLMRTAQAKVDHMIEHGIFQHNDVHGRRMSAAVQDAGYYWMEIAENINRKAITIEQAFNGLCRSPGHRTNILRPMEHIGVGVGVLDNHAYVAVHYGRLTKRPGM